MNFFKQYFYLITISPLFPLMIFFIGGIVWQSSSISLFATCFITVSLLITQWFFHKKVFSSWHITWCILYLLAAVSGALLYKKEINSYNEFYTFSQNCPIEIT